MSSTNKTTNYELSQYVGADKPTYLGDYNSDMLKIDTQMKTNADNISANTTAISTASTTANTALTNAGTAQTTAEGAQTTANTASSTATSALNKALANESAITSINGKLNNYDNTEKVVGTYFGQPLYQKTYQGNSPNSGTYIVLEDFSSDPIEMIDMFGIANGTDNIQDKIGLYASGNNKNYVEYANNNNNLFWTFGSSFLSTTTYPNKKYRITVLYIKLSETPANS